MKITALEFCDFYKTDHRRQYPEGTELVVSNLTPRSGRHSNTEIKDQVVTFGLQYFIKDFLIRTFNGVFFSLPKEKVVEIYKRRMDTALGKDAVSTDHIEALHDLGYLPIEIKALPEGTRVPIGIPVLTIHNTRPEQFWLVNYLETILSTYMWLPCTSATTAGAYRELFEQYATTTGSSQEFVDWQGHDFSMRGMSSLQSSMMSGAAHLLFFKGTDTIPAISFLESYYNANADKELIGGSVPATEHSVMCMGEEDNELETFRRIINHVYPKGIVSIVSDTWDFWKVLTDYAVVLKKDIITREGKVVFRPDSGNPADILCGDPMAIDGSPEHYGAVELLWSIFGGTETSTGHRLLNEHVGLIYGDSISYNTAKEILSRLAAKGFASGNVVLGVGSYTYQYVTRDTWGWAVKATYGVVNGQPRNIFKKPKTDSGEKNSAKGLLMVRQTPRGLILEQEVTWTDFVSPENMLQTVFKDGQLLKEETLSEIRNRVKI